VISKNLICYNNLQIQLKIIINHYNILNLTGIELDFEKVIKILNEHFFLILQTKIQQKIQKIVQTE